ncbi:MAG TPA: DUF3048 domain-containing protein [Bacillales bacterium]|nr:DUF3048 domain-containing protein [Bacillales bacterium]
MKRKWMTGFFILIFVFGLVACKSSSEETNTSKKPSEEQEPAKTEQPSTDEPKETEEPEDQAPAFIYPLTGKPADHEIHKRPIGVMVENSAPARPQTGIYKADIVYEALAEGAITRFLAIFQSKEPEIIGPVRSARHYFVKINNGYNGIYVHHGWSPQAKSLIKSSGTDNINGLYYDGTLFHRVEFRSAPHNSYIPYENIIKGAKENDYKLKADVEPLTFLSEKQVKNLNGESATEVKIDYLDRYQVRFEYQPDTKTYLRYSDGEKSVDRKTNTPITVSNVFIAAVPTFFIDSYPRRGMDLKAGGEALLIRNGVVQKLHWKNIDGRIVPVKNGEPVGFVPGQTWVNLVPTDPGISASVTINGRDDSAN